MTPTLFSMLPLLARGRLRAAAGDYVRARADLEDALQPDRVESRRFPWANDARVALVPVLPALGDDDAARAVADEALATATAAAVARAAIGGALRVARPGRGRQAGSGPAPPVRRTHSPTSPALLWRAEAYVDLGAALRRDGQARQRAPGPAGGHGTRTPVRRHTARRPGRRRAARRRRPTPAARRHRRRRADRQRAAGRRAGRRAARATRRSRSRCSSPSAPSNCTCPTPTASWRSAPATNWPQRSSPERPA